MKLTIRNIPLRLKVEKKLPSLRFEVLDVLRFIENKVPPTLAPESLMILDDQLVRRNAHMESIRLRPSCKKITSEQLELETSSSTSRIPVRFCFRSF